MKVEIPQALIDSLKQVASFDEDAFRRVHEMPAAITSIRINPAKPPLSLPPHSKIPWARDGYYLDDRPSFTFDPLFHAGCYYVQEASSMFLEQAVIQCCPIDTPLKVLDLCAAPGGKTTHLQSLLDERSLLVSNEVIRSRVNILKDNMIKWGRENVVITNNDPSDFEKLENYFDLVVVDAPCSGSGLFRKDPDAINEWSSSNVALCTQRQQRILSAVIPALNEGGILIYSTCSYSPGEDEGITDWILNDHPLELLSLKLDPSWNIVDTGKGYRFWPDRLKGEGFFITVFRKRGEKKLNAPRIKKKPAMLSSKELAIVGQWIDTNGRTFIKYGQTVYSWPSGLVNEFTFMLQEMRVVLSGLLVGELVHDKLIPAHALALSIARSATVEEIELKYEDAIRFLQRKDIQLSTSGTGWKVATYQHSAIGWMNMLKNRINNYYPTELRIRKEKPD